MSSGSDPTRCAAAPLDHPNRGRAPRSSKPAWPNIWRLSILIRAGPERLARVEQGHVWCVRLWVTDGAGRRPLRSARPRPAAVRRWRIAPPPTPCRSEPTTARSPRPRPRGRRPVRHRVRLGAPAGEMRQLARCLQLGAMVDGGRHAGTGVHRLGAPGRRGRRRRLGRVGRCPCGRTDRPGPRSRGRVEPPCSRFGASSSGPQGRAHPL